MDGELLSIKDLAGTPMLVVKITAASEGLEETLGQQRAWPATGDVVGAAPGDRLHAIVSVSPRGAVIVKSIKKLPAVFVERDLDFVTIGKGPYSGRKEAGCVAVRNREDFEKLWAEYASSWVPRPELPEVDFNEKTVLAVFMGEFPTGGYGIDIEKVTEKEKEVAVFVVKRNPAAGMPVTEAFTRPYCIAVIDKVDKPVTFTEKTLGAP
jgi:hypothetical protein